MPATYPTAMLGTAFLLGIASLSPAQTGDVLGVHDPSVIEGEGRFSLFSTGGMLAIRQSPDLRSWRRVGTVFKQLPAWTREAVPGVTGLWAPDISYFAGEYHLYYSVSTFGKNRSAIGLATTRTLDLTSPDYHWDDRGEVIASRPGRDDWNAIDPHLVLDRQGEPWLSFGSFWSGIKLVRIDSTTGMLLDDRILSLAGRHGGAIEAPFIVLRGDYFYLFASFDQCCKGAASTYKIMVGRAREVTGPYLDRQGNPMTEGNGTLVLESQGHIRGPGHNAVLASKSGDWLIHHYYDAEANGRAKLQIRPMTWGDAGWPVAGEPLPAPSGR